MPTTAKGLYYPDDTTNVAPLHPVMAAMQSSVDAYLTDNMTIHPIPNTGARAGLVALYPPSASKPLFAWRQDADTQYKLEYTVDGTNWVAYTAGATFLPTYASTGARDTAYPSPTVGMMCNVGSDMYRCNVAGSWTLWSRVKTAFTPTITGITAGFVVSNTHYWVTSGVGNFKLTLNCTGALTGSELTLTLPVALDIPAWTDLGAAILNPAGSRYSGRVVTAGATTDVWVKYGGTAGQPVTITPTVPATWSARSQAVSCWFSAPLA